MKKASITIPLLLLLFLPLMVHGDGTKVCNLAENEDRKIKEEDWLHILLVESLIPLGRAIGLLFGLFSFDDYDNDPFRYKATVAALMLGEALVHVLPHAFEILISPCVGSSFESTGIVAMLTAFGFLVRGNVITRPYRPLLEDSRDEYNLHCLVSQVLKSGFVTRSLVFGILLGISRNLRLISCVSLAIAYYQLADGFELGLDILQAKHTSRAIKVAAFLSSFITPIGIAIGLGISKLFDADSPLALTVEGVITAASGGMMIYMAFVGLLSVNIFTKPNSRWHLVEASILLVLEGALFYPLIGKLKYAG